MSKSASVIPKSSRVTVHTNSHLAESRPLAASPGAASPAASARYGHHFSQVAVFPPVLQRQAEGEELKWEAEGVPAGLSDVPAAVGGGNALPVPVRGKMERAFGHSFSDVRVHSGGEASQVGALAYTRGTDIHFQPGLYAPDSREGQELLGHELTHVVQQRAGRVSAPQPKSAGAAPINADAGLEAEADALGARAARGEGAQVSGAGVGTQLKADPQAPIQCKGFFNRLFGGGSPPKPDDKLTDETLLPDYSKDGADKGNINSVDLVTYSHNIGNYQTGYFKPEQQSGDLGMAAQAVGIQEGDLRASNRAVASSKVDDLLGLNAVAKTRHAEHSGTVGSVSEQAPGRQVRTLQDTPLNDPGAVKMLDENPFLLKDSGGDTKYGKNEDGSYVVKDAISRHNHFDYARPETQKGFNDLQWEDALTGQMDRHGGNIFVDDLTGKVTGIDNDAAFGGAPEAHNPADLAKYGTDGKSDFRVGEKGHNLGLPQMIDADTARRFKDLSSKDLKKQLGGELSDDEVEATLQRLKHIQKHVKGLEKNGMVVGATDKKGRPTGNYDSWNNDTLEAEKQNAQFSYLGHAATSYDEAAAGAYGREAEAAHEVDPVKAASLSERNRSPKLQTAPLAPLPAPPAPLDPALQQLVSSRMSDSVFAPNSDLPGVEPSGNRPRALSGPYGVPIPVRPRLDPALEQLMSSRMNDPVYGPNSSLPGDQEEQGRPRALSGPYGVQFAAPPLAEPPVLGLRGGEPSAPKKGIADRLAFFEELTGRKS